MTGPTCPSRSIHMPSRMSRCAWPVLMHMLICCLVLSGCQSPAPMASDAPRIAYGMRVDESDDAPDDAPAAPSSRSSRSDVPGSAKYLDEPLRSYSYGGGCAFGACAYAQAPRAQARAAAPPPPPAAAGCASDE